MIDSHAHLYLEDFRDDIDLVIANAREAGITNILLPNIDKSSIDAMINLENHFSGYCHSMMGLHPCSVKGDFEQELYVVEEWLGKRDFLAVGEIGTDLYWDKTFWSQQQEAFKIQCEWALKLNLPVVIHCRESIEETIKLVLPFAEQGLKGVFHCFAGSKHQADSIRNMGFYIGIGGVVTFKNGGLIDVIADIGIDKVILETDSPYLTPAPFRGKRNESAYLHLINSKIAEQCKLPPEIVIQRTTENVSTLFNL